MRVYVPAAPAGSLSFKIFFILCFAFDSISTFFFLAYCNPHALHNLSFCQGEGKREGKGGEREEKGERKGKKGKGRGVEQEKALKGKRIKEGEASKIGVENGMENERKEKPEQKKKRERALWIFVVRKTNVRWGLDVDKIRMVKCILENKR